MLSKFKSILFKNIFKQKYIYIEKKRKENHLHVFHFKKERMNDRTEMISHIKVKYTVDWRERKTNKIRVQKGKVEE